MRSSHLLHSDRPSLGPAEYAEALLKWAWIAGMLLAISLMLTSATGSAIRIRGTPAISQWRGWQLAALAHAGVWYGAQAPHELARRAPAVPVPLVLTVSAGAAASTWMTIAAIGVAAAGRHNPGDRRKWARRVIGLAAAAVVTGAVSAGVWFYLRSLSPGPGLFVWLSAPAALIWGVGRLTRSRVIE